MSPIEHPRRQRRLGRKGVAALEFGLMAPVLMLLVFVMMDLVLQMRTYYRVERMAGEILNAIAQLDPVTRSGIIEILAAASSIGGGDIAITNAAGEDGDDGAIHVTALQRNSDGNANQVLWRVTSDDNPPTLVQTRLGGTAPRLPGNVIVPSGAQFIAVEVLSQRSWLSGITEALTGGATGQVLYAIAVARPRTANITGTLP